MARLMVPCTQTKDFMKFLGIVIILYMGEACADIPHRLGSALTVANTGCKAF